MKDQATGNDFGRQETSDGETVRGEYRVQLPDGRTQIVTYTADWRTGFHADVRYEGTATYPDRYNPGYNVDQGFGYQGNQIAGGGGYTGGVCIKRLTHFARNSFKCYIISILALLDEK